MGGFFGVVGKSDCVSDLFYGTDYHSHLGTRRGGLVVLGSRGYTRFIHDITTTPFRSKFENDIQGMAGNQGIGIISDFEDQPLLIHSHLGTYAIATVGVIRNLDSLAARAFSGRGTHFAEVSGGEINPTELAASLINLEANFVDGLARVQDCVEGSMSVLLLTTEGVYAARDRLGRTPVILGRKPTAYAATLETCAFPNLDFEAVRDLGPGEIVLLTPDGIVQKKPAGSRLQICSFLWVYYGYPASSYEGINVEACRNRCGIALAQKDMADAPDGKVPLDVVAGIPDSGTGHAIGYANAANVPYRRPFVKYTPTWPRSFMPQDQPTRKKVAQMKLIPIRELIDNQRLLFCDDSIVRGTQLGNTISRLYSHGAKEVHMRPACPPLIYGCKFLNFSRNRTELDLAGRTAINELEGHPDRHLPEYANPCSDRHCAMVESIRRRLGLSSLRYQRLDDLVRAIGRPKESLCTYCWDGQE